MDNKLKELRKSKGLLQKDIAKILNVSDSTYSYWEMGKFDIDLKSLQKLANFFNVTIDYILNRDNVTAKSDINKVTLFSRNGPIEEIVFSDEDLETAKVILKALKEKNRTEPKDL